VNELQPAKVVDQHDSLP